MTSRHDGPQRLRQTAIFYQTARKGAFLPAPASVIPPALLIGASFPADTGGEGFRDTGRKEQAGEDRGAQEAGMAAAAFPYLGSIAQYWGYYASACEATRSEHPFELGYHVMLGVIGISFTVENSLKALYEHTMGWLSERLSGRDTAEDAFTAQTAVEYGTFMHTVPWYRFSFARKLTALDRRPAGRAASCPVARATAGADGRVPGQRGLWMGDRSGFGKRVRTRGLDDSGAGRPRHLDGPSRDAHRFGAVHGRRCLRGQDSPIRSLYRSGAVAARPRGRFLDIAGNDEILISVLAPTSLDADTPSVGQVVATSDPDGHAAFAGGAQGAGRASARGHSRDSIHGRNDRASL